MPHTYGWKKPTSAPDAPRFPLLTEHAQVSLPPSLDLRPHCPPVYDQGQLGSCTANSWAGLAEFLLLKETKPDFVPSRLLIYYLERALDGTTADDSGAELKDGAKVLSTLGCCDEKLWPYNIKKFATKPTKAVLTAALKNKITNFWTFDNKNVENLKLVLSYGFPFVFGFTVYESMESEEVAKTGLLPMPKKGEQVMGGHAVQGVGYDDAKKVFVVRNSWGPDWGDKGYFYMPYSYITDSALASDFWTAHALS